MFCHWLMNERGRGDSLLRIPALEKTDASQRPNASNGTTAVCSILCPECMLPRKVTWENEPDKDVVGGSGIVLVSSSGNAITKKGTTWAVGQRSNCCLLTLLRTVLPANALAMIFQTTT